MKRILTPAGMTYDRSSIVMEWLLKDGDYVKRGDIIVNLESGEFSTAYKTRYTGIIKIEINEEKRAEANSLLCTIDDDSQCRQKLFQTL